MAQHVSVFGIFTDQNTAGAALDLLQSNGFGQSQINVEKRFTQALAGFEWSHAMYVRLPEGIVAGFASGGLLAMGGSCLMAHGIPPMFPLAVAMGIGSVVGTILGAFTGVVVARYETRQPQSNEAGDISIGVLCLDAQAEDKARVAFRRAGAATIATQ